MPPQLTDLPDELLLEIFARSFPNINDSGQHHDRAPPTLQNHILSKRLYNLAHQAFFETFIHHVRIEPDRREWDQGTLLHDLYSPTFSKQGHLRNIWAFVTNVQNLSIVISVDDRGQVSTALHEAVRELRRYPKLKKVDFQICVQGGRDIETTKLQEGLVKSSMKGVTVVVADHRCLG